MADSTIDSELFTLLNNWGCAPGQVRNEPHDGFASTAGGNNSSKAKRPLGTVIQMHNKGNTGKAGMSSFIYLLVGTQNANSVIAVKSVVVQDSATAPLTITNDPDDLIKLPTGQAAIALSAMTNSYYGWFWCGGVCPEELVSGLGGNYATEGNLLAGPFTAHDLAADYIGLGPANDAGAGTIQEGCFGHALATDA